MEYEVNLSKFGVIKLIGQGSFGKVYQARYKATGNLCALKFIPKRGKAQEELTLREEVNIQRGLRHPNIVQMYDAFETATDIVAVSEYVPLQLHHMLATHGVLSEAQVRPVSCELLSAIHYLHSHSIIHR